MDSEWRTQVTITICVPYAIRESAIWLMLLTWPSYSAKSRAVGRMVVAHGASEIIYMQERLDSRLSSLPSYTRLRWIPL